MTLNRFPVLLNHHQNQVSVHFHHPKCYLIPFCHQLPILTLAQEINLYSVAIELPYLTLSCKWNHICGLLLSTMVSARSNFAPRGYFAMSRDV